MDDHFEAQRRRLRQEMQAEIERIQATYRRRIDAVDRAEELMEFAASGETDPIEDGDQAYERIRFWPQGNPRMHGSFP